MKFGVIKCISKESYVVKIHTHTHTHTHTHAKHTTKALGISDKSGQCVVNGGNGVLHEPNLYDR